MNYHYDHFCIDPETGYGSEKTMMVYKLIPVIVCLCCKRRVPVSSASETKPKLSKLDDWIE